MVTEDKILQGKTRSRREFCSYYTESDPILSYMVNRLEISEDDSILEPCAGDGVFIEKIVKLFPGKFYKIEALDLNPKAVTKLRASFQSENIQIRQADTLLDLTLDLYANMNGHYTKVIGNPPYGAWQDYDKRSVLKKRYGGHVRETYTLFIRRAIDLLKENGKLVFIVPDTFLALHLHKETREKILKHTRVDEILLIPSKFFPGVNFGYSNLCIITLTKGTSPKNHKIKIAQVKTDIKNLYKISNRQYSVSDNYEEIEQEKIIKSIDHSFFIGGNTKIRKLINECETTLGDVAHCVTGFCSGNNQKFYKPLSLNIKNTKNYTPIDQEEVDFDYLRKSDLINGLTGKKKYIPLIKGGNGAFLREMDWFALWDKETVNFYRTDKKARFQNSQYYFKEGIGVPMVKSSKLKAFLLEKRLFDQSIVGIFPKDEKHLYYILAFLNSDICNSILKVINHTANNSANYLKKLPIIIDEKYFNTINRLVKKILSDENAISENTKKINELFKEIYQIDNH